MPIEYAIICKDYKDVDFSFSYLMDAIPKKDICAVNKIPTRYTIELYGASPTRLHIMTKTYYERMFQCGYRGKTISSKKLDKVLNEIRGGNR